MRGRRELIALIVAILVALAVLAAFLFVDDGQPTAPIDRVNEQNTGTDAPSEVAPPADAGNQPAPQ